VCVWEVRRGVRGGGGNPQQRKHDECAENIDTLFLTSKGMILPTSTWEATALSTTSLMKPYHSVFTPSISTLREVGGSPIALSPMISNLLSKLFRMVLINSLSFRSFIPICSLPPMLTRSDSTSLDQEHVAHS
jgi:hypothetical protein